MGVPTTAAKLGSFGPPVRQETRAPALTTKLWYKRASSRLVSSQLWDARAWDLRPFIIPTGQLLLRPRSVPPPQPVPRQQVRIIPRQLLVLLRLRRYRWRVSFPQECSRW